MSCDAHLLEASALHRHAPQARQPLLILAPRLGPPLPSAPWSQTGAARSGRCLRTALAAAKKEVWHLAAAKTVVAAAKITNAAASVPTFLSRRDDDWCNYDRDDYT